MRTPSPPPPPVPYEELIPDALTSDQLLNLFTHVRRVLSYVLLLLTQNPSLMLVAHSGFC